MSPSCPAYSPNVISSSTSRSRCSMTCLAVVAAIRPKPAGVSSYSLPGAPSGPVSLAQTVTWPFFLSISTRATGLAPSVLWYAISSASSIALIAVSDEMSFSFSRLRSTLRSMSIAASSKVGVLIRHRVVKLRIAKVVELGVRNPAELHLDAARTQVGMGEPALTGGQVERDAVGVGRQNPSLQGAFPGDLHLDEPAPGSPPVPRLGQRPARAGCRHPKGVGNIAERAVRVG